MSQIIFLKTRAHLLHSLAKLCYTYRVGASIYKQLLLPYAKEMLKMYDKCEATFKQEHRENKIIVAGGELMLAFSFGSFMHQYQKEIEFAKLRADIGQQLTRQYIDGLENERQRMSRELHDGVCNDLLAIEMNISSGKSVESTLNLIGACREAVRRISHELMPPEFAYANIDEVVRFYVNKQAEANSGKVAINYTSTINDAD